MYTDACGMFAVDFDHFLKYSVDGVSIHFPTIRGKMACESMYFEMRLKSWTIGCVSYDWNLSIYRDGLEFYSIEILPLASVKFIVVFYV